uniref:PI3K/PI4K catalytic domain-containing protein n=1 Tax=Strigamia maritima TaxID=126957 RepID=T1J1T4_STRMM
MQFISIINSMFVRNRRQGKFVYHARHYSVTPLGPRSGLIQWVDGATPLFGLYKRWQQREAAALALKSTGTSGNPSIAASTMRPSEIYYNKLTPLLKEKGIVNLDVRKDWPISVLRQVLLELMEETPRDLLAKELWCSSSTAMEWWKTTETYSQSTAVMSMIGYIIGLGDRHLDNVLVDLATGEVVHIDYNVCFEKGRNLRVPEKVPFRMTPNIESALGVTGAEGIFRVSCEQVLKTMRRGRETLLTLLEAFVYDPLIDWTPGGEGGYTGAVYGGGQLVGMETRQSKLDMEQEITYSMFSIRITEMKAEWSKNKEELLESLPVLEKYLKNWMESQKKLLEEEEALQAHHQEMAYLKEAEVNPAHSFYSLPHRYTEFTVVKNSLQIAKKAAQEKLNECERWHNIHKVSMIAVTGGPELGRWCNEATKVIDFSISSFAPVIDFLRTAGQSQLLAQCEQADSELANLLHQHQSMLRSCLDTLNTYATVAIQYPASYLELNRCFKWQKWLLELQNNFTLSECHKIVGKFNSEFGMDRLSQTCMNTAQAVLTVEFQLQTLITNTNGRLLKLYERIRIENLDKVSLLVSNLDESKNAIYEFINACPKSGSMSLACVLLTALCSLNKRCLMMEGAAFAAGDRLVDLTSRDGDWFLDEVFSISSNVMQLLTLLRTNCQFIDDDIIKAIDGVAAVHRVIGSLEDLHLNFLTIILPEALKHIQSQERTVFQALQSLNSVINNVGYPLETLISQLELQMRSVVMEMDIPDAKATAIVEHIRNKFNSLVKDATNDNSNSGLSPGQMLFMGFDGLFTKLEQDFVEALDIMNRLVLPTCWRKVDLVKESKNLLAPVFLEPALVILRDIFFLKRLQAMQDFFTLSQHQARALLTILKEENDMQSYGAVYDDDHLTRPIKIFIADFVNKQLLGLLSQSLSYVVCLLVRVCGVNVTAEIELRDVGAENKVSLEELCRKAIDMSLKEDALKANQLSQASSLASAYENAWKKQDIARRLDQNILMLKSSLQRIQLQLASHQWLHEDILLPSNVLHNLATPTRASVMSEMRKTMQVLLAIESNLNVSRDRFVNLVSSVEQRLKWAVGANPSVTAILDEFEQSVTVKNDMISNFTKIGGEVTTTCSTILHCEALRTRTSEAISSDATFLQLINRCQESCLMAENCTMDVSSLEERLVEMKPLNGQLVTKEWILLVTEVVTNLTNEVQGQLAHRKVDMFCRWDCIKNQVMCIRSQLTTHHHLMSDVRVILKSMAKYEDQEPNCCVHGVKRYLQLYKSYSEKLSTFIREVLTEEMSIARAEELLADMRLLEQQTHDIYDELLQFAVTLTDDDSNDGNSTSNNNVLGTFCSILFNLLIGNFSKSFHSRSKGTKQRGRNFALRIVASQAFVRLAFGAFLGNISVESECQ